MPLQVRVAGVERRQLNEAVVACQHRRRVDRDVERRVGAVGNGEARGGRHDGGVLTPLDAQ
jgi:hypothetical protein